jgi:hypothetical protein
VRRLVGESTATVDAPRYTIFAGPALPGATRHVTLHQTTGALDNVRIVEGRLPAPDAGTTRVRIVDQTREAHAFEVALSRTTAGLLVVRPGDRLVLISDPGDPLIRNVPLAERSPLVLRVSGLWEPRDRGSAFWAAQEQLNDPLVEETPGGDHRFVFAYGLFAPGAKRRALVVPQPESKPLSVESPVALAEVVGEAVDGLAGPAEVQPYVQARGINLRGSGRFAKMIGPLDRPAAPARHAASGCPVHRHVVTGWFRQWSRRGERQLAG